MFLIWRQVMPIYEYECEICGKEQEIFQKIDDEPPECCNIKMKRRISISSFILKGVGWYKTDYANKIKNKKEE